MGWWLYLAQEKKGCCLLLKHSVAKGFEITTMTLLKSYTKQTCNQLHPPKIGRKQRTEENNPVTLPFPLNMTQ